MNQTAKGTALVTGASSGIGRVYAKRLAEQGFDLVLVARNAQRLHQLATELQPTGRSIEVLPADLAKAADLHAVEERLRRSPSVTMLVNNAGVGSTALMTEASASELEGMIDLNVAALTRLTHAIVPGLLVRGSGAIVNIASIVALAPELLKGATYAATKAYVLNFTQALHAELSDKGVQLQAVLPGATRTDFWAAAGLPVEHLPQQIVMEVEHLVDAALKGFAQKEVVTIPSLPDPADWQRVEDARRALLPNLSREMPADRYR